MPYRRSIYIGIGGLGIQTISKVKKCYDSVINLFDSIVKFVGIDTDIQNLRDSRLSRNECIALQSRNAMVRLHAISDEYTWLPDENRDYLQLLTNHGAGQIRSNGRIAFENNKEEIRSYLQWCLYDISRLRQSGMYDRTVVSNDIDIHIISSLAGGTGSGIIIELAKLVREIIPKSIIIGHFLVFKVRAFNLGYMEQNTYATLFELNCEMVSQNNPLLFNVHQFIDDLTLTSYDEVDRVVDTAANTIVGRLPAFFSPHDIIEKYGFNQNHFRQLVSKQRHHSLFTDKKYIELYRITSVS